MAQLEALKAELKEHADPARATVVRRYFKIGPGQYGEGDVFLGVPVPAQRKIAKKYQDLSLADIKVLLYSPEHEYRLTALFILVLEYKKADNEVTRAGIVDFYLQNKVRVNNWDLVDSSAPYILGDYLLDKSKDRLYELVQSASVWDRRIAIVATWILIRHGQFDDIFKLAEILLTDTHDLIHKATGWMLREVGNQDPKALVQFLDTHYQKMPRTMLRYAIEKFPPAERAKYLAKTE